MKNLSLLFFLLCLPMVGFSHGSHGSGFMAGFTHPILGLDHNLAIIACGILGFQLDNKKWYLYPLAFLAAMIVGGFLGIEKEATTWIEKIIALSVIILGTNIALKLKSGFLPSLILFSGFGFFHGFAHGSEMPLDTTPFKYISGFSLGTILLSILGFAIGNIFSQKAMNPQYLRFIGGLIAGIGISILLF